jgi:threonine dehydrogenase-like Zn-dependent dehydrogenase
MRQLVVESPGQVSWHDIPEPELQGAGEALVRPLAVALCDMDHSMVSGVAPVPAPIHLGHECVAEVLEVGADVTVCAPGDRVVVPFQISCGACDECSRGLTGSCSGVDQLAMYGFGVFGHEWGGMLTDAVRVPWADAMLVRVPDEIDSEAIASMSDNIPDGLRLVAGPLQANPGADVLVFGGGTRSIALYAAGAAVRLGAGRVDYLDSDPARLAAASDLGANAIETGEVPYRAERAYPVTVDGGTTQESLACAVRSTAPGGTCSTAGILFEPLTPIPLLEMYTTGATLHAGRVMARALIPAALDLVANGLDTQRVTSRVAAWEDAPAAVMQEETKLVISRVG